MRLRAHRVVTPTQLSIAVAFCEWRWIPHPRQIIEQPIFACKGPRLKQDICPRWYRGRQRLLKGQLGVARYWHRHHTAAGTLRLQEDCGLRAIAPKPGNPKWHEAFIRVAK